MSNLATRVTPERVDGSCRECGAKFLGFPKTSSEAVAERLAANLCAACWLALRIERPCVCGECGARFRVTCTGNGPRFCPACRDAANVLRTDRMYGSPDARERRRMEVRRAQHRRRSARLKDARRQSNLRLYGSERKPRSKETLQRPMNAIEKKCVRCLLVRKIEFFARRKLGGRHGYHSMCRDCVRAERSARPKLTANIAAYQRAYLCARRYRARVFVWSVLTSSRCVDCGISDPRVLDFDHIDPRTKTAEISRMMQGRATLDHLALEVEKCVTRCRNCHGIRTMRDAGSWRIAAFEGRLEGVSDGSSDGGARRSGAEASGVDAGADLFGDRAVGSELGPLDRGEIGPAGGVRAGDGRMAGVAAP